MTVAAMVDELTAFPTDLVGWALRRWSRTETWQPALADILALIRPEMRWRESLDRVAEPQERTPEAERVAYSALGQEERDRFDAMLADVYRRIRA